MKRKKDSYRLLIISLLLLSFLVCRSEFSSAADRSASSQFDRNKLSASDVSILDEIDKLESEMDRLEAEEKKAVESVRAADSEIKKLETEVAERQKKIAAQQSAAAAQLRSLYKRSRVGEWEYLLDTRSLQDFERRRQALLKLGRREAQIIDNYRTQLVELDARRKSLAEKKNESENQRQKIVESRRSMAEEIKRKAALIKTVREDKQLMAKAEKEMNEARKASDSSIAMLKKNEPPADATPGFEYLLANKGSIACPIGGKIIQSFGEITTGKKETIFHSGLDIRATAGAPVKSIAGGKVVFSGKLRGYGKLVVIDHGRGYLSLYGYLEKINVRQDSTVSRGYEIGRIGDGNSLKGPTLFFGLRKGGQPENPKSWTDCR